jgi:nucleotide-binding universal stress UspA family protein
MINGDKKLEKELITLNNREKLEALENTEYFLSKRNEEKILDAADDLANIIANDMVTEVKAKAKAEIEEAKAEAEKARAESKRLKDEVSKFYGLPYEKVIAAAKKLDGEA